MWGTIKNQVLPLLVSFIWCCCNIQLCFLADILRFIWELWRYCLELRFFLCQYKSTQRPLLSLRNYSSRDLCFRGRLISKSHFSSDKLSLPLSWRAFPASLPSQILFVYPQHLCLKSTISLVLHPYMFWTFSFGSRSVWTFKNAAFSVSPVSTLLLAQLSTPQSCVLCQQPSLPGFICPVLAIASTQ